MMSVKGIAGNTLLKVFDQTSDLVIVRNAAGKTVYSNKAASEFGCSALEALPWLAALNTSVIPLENSQGVICTLRCRCQQITADCGESYQTLICTDITEVQRASDALSEQRRVLSSKTRAMDTLNTVTLELINRLDLHSLLQHVADNTGRITAADYSYVAMVHESGDFLHTIAASRDRADLRAIKHRKGQGVCGEAWRSGQSEVTTDYQRYENRMAVLTDIRQACAVPLKIDGHVVGVIGVMYRSYKVSADDQLDILQKLARLVSVAIENTTLHETGKTELASAQAIGELSRSMNSAKDFNALLNEVCTTTLRVFNANKVCIYQIAKDQTLQAVASWSEIDGDIRPAAQIAGHIAARSIAGWCIENQETAFLRRGVRDSRQSKEGEQLKNKARLGSMVCVPLVHNNQCRGVIYIHRKVEQADFTEHEIKMFSIIANQTSIALHRHELLEEIQHLAYYDNLTGLPNRYTFEKTLADTIEIHSDQQRAIAVLFIDLDGFKAVNDNLGHRIGDELLKQLSTRLSKQLGGSGTLARLGGDEFAIILPDTTEDQAHSLSTRLLEVLAETFTIENANVKIGASIGLSCYPDHAAEAGELIKKSDMAMYTAKNHGKGITCIYNPRFAERYEKRAQLEQDLKRAIDDQQFELYYQPKVCSISHVVSGVEALIRWNHPHRGMVSPAEFIPVAEESGLIQEIGTWVIDQACRDGGVFRRAGLDISVAVNISAQQFAKSNFSETVIELLDKHKFPGRNFELEVTESVVMKDVALVVQRLERLRSKGIKIAIDDFGTGYSSLKYLEDLPLDVLKIDKAFVDKLDGTVRSESLVKTIILMAESFGLTTVAEGVETAAQVKRLRQLGCEYIQGYYFSKPVPAAMLLQKIEAIQATARLEQAA